VKVNIQTIPLGSVSQKAILEYDENGDAEEELNEETEVQE